MALLPKINFGRLTRPKNGVAVCFCDGDGKLGAKAKELDDAAGNAISRAIKIADFPSSARSVLPIIAPAEGGCDKIFVLSTGTQSELNELTWELIGGAVMGALGNPSKKPVTVLVERVDGGKISAESIAAVAAGLKLRAYKFDKFITKSSSKAKKSERASLITIASSSPTPAKRAWNSADAVSDGTIVARDLVNEPPNLLGPVEFAAEAQKLEALGVKVRIMGEPEMGRHKMNALLGVGQGSTRPSRLVVMEWNGGRARQAPIAFVGKGVVFDTGGISLKPAGGMEDMKGDMGGAAAVTGLMHALAARGAKVNAIGILGLVENMPDGNAQRPGDVVTSMSGQTIEIINTDAEGRLVLADALWYCEETFKPKVMIDLATLTGACMVALGKDHAGLFTDDDELAKQLSDAGISTGEKVWRLPLGDAYDKMIDTKNADMKNTGGRWAGSITAAQFLKRFVRNTAWAHLDIAGTALGSPETDVNRSWSSGYGVALLNKLVEDHYE